MNEDEYLYLVEEEQYSFCLVQALINGQWTPMGITRATGTSNDFDSASALSDELRETGRITCIVPTENWTFVTLDTRACPIKISPFTRGHKDVRFIKQNFKELGLDKS